MMLSPRPSEFCVCVCVCEIEVIPKVQLDPTPGLALLVWSYRYEAARTVRRTDGDRGRAEVLLERAGRDEVGQHDDERQDELDPEPLPGGEGWAVGNGRLQIALITGHGDTVEDERTKKDEKIRNIIKYTRAKQCENLTFIPGKSFREDEQIFECQNPVRMSGNLDNGPKIGSMFRRENPLQAHHFFHSAEDDR